jgi:hypothetical protein
MDIAGHVSKQMLKHYSHIRMEAKRAALESILEKSKKDRPENPSLATQIDSDVPAIAQKSEEECLQKSLQLPVLVVRSRLRTNN